MGALERDRDQLAVYRVDDLGAGADEGDVV